MWGNSFVFFDTENVWKVNDTQTIHILFSYFLVKINIYVYTDFSKKKKQGKVYFYTIIYNQLMVAFYSSFEYKKIFVLT